ncbi:hypothetical protein BKH41_01845 [Helicobacter sp. 12S02232-10]|uniref:hypothetical protein n=1 Tax=Helicobacter sp. 12S02232-10 TaxID=1476197 RepID=UPI000BA54C92|nr:hypothetical protein [Helicobacter sp. 12S02232-10]PAF49433.1 hypothetical protein BKH41_01845 [Helicobacter sp. 12S02232-10]
MNRNIDDFMQNFMYFYRLLGKNKDRFFEQLIKEVSNLKENENIESNNFIQVLKEELLHLEEKESVKTEAENLRDLDENRQKEQNSLQKDNSELGIAPKISQTLGSEQEIENTSMLAGKVPSTQENTPKTFVLPFPSNHFELILEKNINDFIKKSNPQIGSKLSDLNIIKNIDFNGNSFKVFSKNALLSEERINGLRNDYAKSYLKTLGNEIGSGMQFLGLNAKGEILLSSKMDLSQTDFLTMVKSQKILRKNTENLEFNWDINHIENYQKGSKEFIDRFENEIKDIFNGNQSLEISENSQETDLALQEKNLNNPNSLDVTTQINPNPMPKDNLKPQGLDRANLENSHQSNRQSDVAPLLDFFDKLKIQHEHMAIGKDQFKKEFLIYSKTQMKENEMKVLLRLLNKEPSKLTSEHQKLIKSGLAYGLGNQNLLDKDLGIAIKNQLKIELKPDEKEYLQQKNTESKKIENELKNNLANEVKNKVANQLENRINGLEDKSTDRATIENSNNQSSKTPKVLKNALKTTSKDKTPDIKASKKQINLGMGM